jgi:hypothetical protein
MLGVVRLALGVAGTLPTRDVEADPPYPIIRKVERMARRARKSRARKKKKANHGKRPTAR